MVNSSVDLGCGCWELSRDRKLKMETEADVIFVLYGEKVFHLQ